VKVTPVTAFQVKVGSNVVSAGPGDVDEPGPTTTGAGSVAAAGVASATGAAERNRLASSGWNWEPLPIVDAVGRPVARGAWVRVRMVIVSFR
jgi:hypothetical protein